VPICRCPITDDATRSYITALLGDETLSERTTTTDAASLQPTTHSTSTRERSKASAAALQQLGRDRAVLVNADWVAAIVRLG